MRSACAAERYTVSQREHAREDAGYFRGHRGDLVHLRRRLTQGQQAVVAQVDRLRRRARAPPVFAQTLPHSMGQWQTRIRFWWADGSEDTVTTQQPCTAPAA